MLLHLTAGDLLEADVANRTLSTAGEDGGSSYVPSTAAAATTAAWASSLQGLIHLQRGEWEAAAESLERTVAQAVERAVAGGLLDSHPPA